MNNSATCSLIDVICFLFPSVAPSNSLDYDCGERFLVPLGSMNSAYRTHCTAHSAELDPAFLSDLTPFSFRPSRLLTLTPSAGRAKSEGEHD